MCADAAALIKYLIERVGEEQMKKIKIYLDTSVIGYLDQQDDPEKMNDTLKLWNTIEYGKYDTYLSETTLDEINECHESKKDILYKYLSQITYNTINTNDEIIVLAGIIIDEGILKKKSFDDCMHIASAIVANCDIIVSWNFKHMVRVETINGVRKVCFANGYRIIDIYPPTLLIDKGDD